MPEKKLGHIIKEGGKDAAKTDALLNEAPYSQAVQNLKNDGSALSAIMRYSWKTELEGSDALTAPEDVLQVESIELKEEKTKRKAPPKTRTRKTRKSSSVVKDSKTAEPADVTKLQSESSETQEVEKTTESTSKRKKAAPVKKRSTSAKKKASESTPKAQASSSKLKKSSQVKAVATEPELDDFTKWLNSLDASEEVKIEKKKESPAKKLGSSKKRKSKKTRKKDEIKEMIDNSVKDKDNIITESLAQLYESQGYYEQAIEVYENLSLKFPEKSSFFAAQIEKIKDKI